MSGLGLYECPYCEGTGKEGPLVPDSGRYLGTCSFCGGKGIRDYLPRRAAPAPCVNTRYAAEQARIADFIERNERYL